MILYTVLMELKGNRERRDGRRGWEGVRERAMAGYK